MANKQALRDLQSRLAERLKEVRTTAPVKAWLAVECGPGGFLFPLREAGEIFGAAPIQPVPHSHRWFLGVANLRGRLHGVVDLAAFLGLRSSEPARAPAHLVGFNQIFEINCALAVDRLAGLRKEGDLTLLPDDAGERPASAGARLRDAGGRVWQELNLSALAVDEAFLRIVG